MKKYEELTVEEKFKEFVLYFRELDKKGLSWGIDDLKIKAKELKIE